MQTAQGAFMYLLGRVMEDGVTEIVRGQKTKELCSVSVRIMYPLQRCYTTPYRNDNIFAKIAETLWMISGRGDIEWLSHYLPRAPEWSDDGKVWRAAYGPRLRNWHGHDQLANVVKLLNDDPQSRRAVMSIWDPAEDYVDSKDVPCTNWLHFFIRSGKLHLNIAQRSCDILWGFSGVNSFEWSVLHQMMAHWTNTKVGVVTYNISSLHLYERHWARAEKILDHARNSMYELKYVRDSLNVESLIKSAEFKVDFEEFDEAMHILFLTESSIRARVDNLYGMPTTAPFLQSCVNMLDIYNLYMRTSEPGWYIVIINKIKELDEYCDFRYAALEYFARRDRSILDHFPNEKEGVLQLLPVEE